MHTSIRITAVSFGVASIYESRPFLAVSLLWACEPNFSHGRHSVANDRCGGIDLVRSHQNKVI